MRRLLSQRSGKNLEMKKEEQSRQCYNFVTQKSKIIVNQYARRMADGKPEYGICGKKTPSFFIATNIKLAEIKCLLGKKFDELYVQNNLQYFPFKIISPSNDLKLSIFPWCLI